MLSRLPWYMKNHCNMPEKPRTFNLYGYVKRAITIMKYEFLFNHNDIISTGLLESNGITKGQLTYTTTALMKMGVVKRYSVKYLKFNFKKAKEMEKTAVFKGIT